MTERQSGKFMKKNETLRVEIHLESTSEPIIYEDAMAVYQKGDMMCVSFKRDGVFMSDKYPIAHIFRVRNTYTGKNEEEKVYYGGYFVSKECAEELEKAEKERKAHEA